MAEGTPDRRREVEQFLDLHDGERDQAGIGRRRLGGAGRGGQRLGTGAGVGGGHGADREGGHDQHDVPHDRGVAAGPGRGGGETGPARVAVFFLGGGGGR